MTKDIKSVINKEANKLAQALAKELAALAIQQVSINQVEPILLEVKWDQANECFVSQYTESHKL